MANQPVFTLPLSLLRDYVRAELTTIALNKAYPHEHAARQQTPDKYQTLRRQNDKFGHGIHAIFGVLPDGKTEVQSIRFSSNKFTPTQARQWLTEHDFKATLEEATQKAANIADRLVAILHRAFTEEADRLFGDGHLTQAERITLSSIIGDALDTFNTAISAQLPHLRITAPDEIVKAIEAETEVSVEIIKTDTEQRLSYGIAYPAMPLGQADTQGDWMSKVEIEKMAHRYMLDSQHYDVQHRVFDLDKSDAVPVQSWIAPVDFVWPLPTGDKQVHEGDWLVVTYYPNEEIWQQVKKGELSAYSIRGRGKRSRLALTETIA